VHALYAGLRDAIAQSTGRVRLPALAGHEVTMLTALVALTGTDFTRKLPQLTGRTVYNWLPDVWPSLALAYDPGSMELREGPAQDLVALLYRVKFPRHAHSPRLEDVLRELREASIGDKTKATLPTCERVAVTVRNVNWVLAYWTCQPAPDPLQPAYGYRAGANGAATYDDAA